MALKIDLPEDLIHDIEQEAVRRHVSPLRSLVRRCIYHVPNRQLPTSNRERVIPGMEAEI